MDSCEHLVELIRQVRGGTLRLLESARPEWLTWAPAGTSNHLLWHAGHALWLGGVLGVEPLTGHCELPTGWAETFGMECRPVRLTTDWPLREEVYQRLLAQQQRLIDLVHEHAARLAAPHLGPRSENAAASLIHGLHDEARHQGEMLLLVKLCRAGAAKA